MSANPSTPFVYTNNNNGTITKVDLSSTPPALTNIFSGGSRGDFAAVGSDRCLYATQMDRVIKVTNADGTCLPPPLGPLFATNPTSIVFASFAAKLDVRLTARSFDLNSTFTLGAGSSGINPIAEPVTLKVGPFTTVIPAAAFQQNPEGFLFEGSINGVALEVMIAPQGGNTFTFKVQGAGVSNLPSTNPVTVGLTIGNNGGSTTVTADIQ